jgi:hypothetical protein
MQRRSCRAHSTYIARDDASEKLPLVALFTEVTNQLLSINEIFIGRAGNELIISQKALHSRLD